MCEDRIEVLHKAKKKEKKKRLSSRSDIILDFSTSSKACLSNLTSKAFLTLQRWREEIICYTFLTLDAKVLALFSQRDQKVFGIQRYNPELTVRCRYNERHGGNVMDVFLFLQIVA